MVAGAAVGTGGEPPPPPLPLGPAHAAVAAIALPVTLFRPGTDSHGSAEIINNILSFNMYLFLSIGW